MRTKRTPCVFFDRDGVVNASPGPGYVERWADFRLLPGFVAALRVVAAVGYPSIVVTNQRGVALGIMSAAAVETIHRNLCALLREQHGLELAEVLYCPHERDTCACRKPKPGMLLTAATRHHVDLARSWMVGDSPRDVQAGRAAGCRTIFVGTDADDGGADYRVANMDELAPLLEELLQQGRPEA